MDVYTSIYLPKDSNRNNFNLDVQFLRSFFVRYRQMVEYDIALSWTTSRQDKFYTHITLAFRSLGETWLIFI